MAERYWLQTLGCPKNQVDSDKLVGTLTADGYEEATAPGDADLVVVNTCAFIEAARQESIDTVLELADLKRGDARLVVTGCMAERYGSELSDALPEIDLVAGFGVPVTPGRQRVALGPRPTGRSAAARDREAASGSAITSFDLLELPRPPASAPWAYVKIAEGCDRICGFCAIPTFRGKQRSRSLDAILHEVDALAGGRPGASTKPPRRVLTTMGPSGLAGMGPSTQAETPAEASVLQEIVLVAQDLASYGLDRTTDRDAKSDDTFVRRSPGVPRPIIDLVRALAERVARVRLLYLYPSALDDELVDVMCATGVPYFDLSLQHVSRPLLRRMRRWGDGERFLDRIAAIRQAEPAAAFRSSFILGYPGETEEDHDALLDFLADADLDWCGFFPYSAEEGTHAAALADQVPTDLVAERLRECGEMQDAITARRREALIGESITVLVDTPGVARSHREAPEIDGIVSVPRSLPVGRFATVTVTGAAGPDLVATLAP